MSQKETTIMYTDIVGYSKLTGDNQELALEILAEHNKILFQNTKYYSGEIVKETGDGICALFNEPADAIKCAIDIQKDLYKRNQLNIGVEHEKFIFQKKLIKELIFKQYQKFLNI